MDEKASLAAVQSRIKTLIAPMRQFAEKKWSKPPTVEELEKLCAAIPKGASIGEVLDASVRELQEVVSAIRKNRGETFGRLVSEYIREITSRGESAAQTGGGWRLGEVELELKPETHQARTMYNQAPLVPASGWTTVSSKDDLAKIIERSRTLLLESTARIPDKDVSVLVSESYNAAVTRRTAAGKPRPDLVPLLELHRMFRSVIVIHELEGQKPDKSLAFADMPRWVFLHVLDRYQQIASAGNPADRLVFQTGSQAETAKGMGYVLGGLDPHQKYRVYCHILRSS